MPDPFTTPGELGRFDQDLAEMNDALDHLVATMRSQVSAHGDAPAVCNLALALEAVPPGSIAGMLVAATRRLALQAVPEPR
jgi:hypothetical protein